MMAALNTAAVTLFLFAFTIYGQRELPIAEVQGNGNASPHAGQSVKVTGVVTARTRTGFFLQTPDDKKDADPNTSEGIFVFTGPRNEPPAEAAVGSTLSATGEVEEYRRENETLASTITEISFRVGRDTLEVKSKGNPLPAPIRLTATDFKPNAVDQLEKYEGMRVAVAEMTVVSPTGGREDNKTGLYNSDGMFTGVLKGTARPFRGPGIDIRELLASVEGEKIRREFPKMPVFDGNPEAIRVDTDEQTGSRPLDVPAQTTVSNITGVLHYVLGRYTIFTDPETRPAVSTGIKASPLPATNDRQFSIAGINIENFFDDQDDPGIREEVTDPEVFQRRLKKISVAVRDLMNLPDVIGVVEIENLNALKRLASQINADAVAAGKTDPKYEAFLFEGNDGRGIDNGFLVKSSRIKVMEVRQFGKDDKYQNPDTKEDVFLNDRPPVMLRASITDPKTNQPFEFTAVVNHLKSFSGYNDPKQQANVRLKKRLQAEFLARWVAERQKANPAERIIILGDLNSYQFSDGVLDMIGTIKGKPAPKDEVLHPSDDLVNTDLVNLVDLINPAQRYSFIFDGNAQVLDHMLITENLRKQLAGFGYARVNADFPEIYRNDGTRPERFSDHDPAVAYFALEAPSARP